MKKAINIINGLSLEEIFKKMVLDLKYTIFILRHLIKDSEKERKQFTQVLIEEISKEPPVLRNKIINRIHSATACLREA